MIIVIFLFTLVFVLVVGLLALLVDLIAPQKQEVVGNGILCEACVKECARELFAECECPVNNDMMCKDMKVILQHWHD